MKKILCFLIIMMLLMCMQTAFADDDPTSFATSVDLWNHWQNERQLDYDAPDPYPDYITGIWTDDNMATLTFGVTKDERGEKGKEELLALIENDDTVKFSYQTYPYNELWTIQLKLTDRMGEDTGVFGMGIYEMENYLHVDIDKTNKNAEAFMDECFKEYGNRIVFEQSDGITITAEEKGYTDAAGGSDQRIWIAVLVPVIMGLIGIFYKKKQGHRAQTSAGTTVGTDGGYTAEQIRQIVKDSAEKPERAVYENILKEIEKK